MPCFRGIELSIVSTADRSAFPEFPHPDGSSARFGRLNADQKHRSSVFLSPRPRAEGSEGAKDDAQKVTPRISVYIPSAPGTCFYIQYSINQPRIGQKYLFFKAHINGRQVVAWGINLHKTTSGATNQALFQPSEHYQYNDDSVVMAEPGIESRCFRFVPNASGTASVAEDGGLIEIQVFRAKTRRRRAPRLDKWLERGRYGVALVSNGLLENPHLADYYDYHLADARDLPYSTFLFHYRSWDNLRQLQLAPPERPDFLCPDSPCKVQSEEDLGGRTDRTAREPEGPAPHSIVRPLPPVPYPPALRIPARGLGEQEAEEKCSLDAEIHYTHGLPAEDDVFLPLPQDSPDEHSSEKSRSAGIMLFPFTDSLRKREVSNAGSVGYAQEHCLHSRDSPTPRRGHGGRSDLTQYLESADIF